MNQHVPEDLLSAFVEGEVGEQLSVHIAGHLDECPACATQAAGMEPLASAFAAMDDPVPPDELVALILEEFDKPEPIPVVEIALGFGLLAAAAAAAATLQSPLGMAIEFGVAIDALATLGSALITGLGASSSALLTLTTLLALGGCFATARLAALTPTPIGVRRLP